MQELLEYIVRSIVTHPDAVVVTQVMSEDQSHVTLRLAVDQEDMGLIIGKEGNIARSLRNLVKVAAMKQNKRVYIDILEHIDEVPAPSETLAA
jgi:predicted RNA-binding protein YlqC (UPF0109 family)